MTDPAARPADWPLTRRAVGFVDHLRLNGFAVGLAETRASLQVLGALGAVPVDAARRSLKALLTGCRDEWERFDALFEAYWIARGRTRTAQRPARALHRPAIWQAHLPEAQAGDKSRHSGAPDEADPDGHGRQRIAASARAERRRADLRHIADPAELAAAEAAALRLARAMRYRLSRRWRARAGAPRLDLRRTIRRNIGHGGEPITLIGRERPDRPVRLVVFLDVSGSMQAYARVFLQFVRGLVGQWAETDAYLVHTRLVRITDVLREGDPMRAMDRLALMAEGFGGGTRLAEALERFNAAYARRALNSRSVAIVISDGYDGCAPERLAAALMQLKRRARRLVWLNPLLGWRDYAPVTAAMAAALPHIDHFAAAHSLEALAALEPELARL